jgi:hypothetical protein
MATSIILTNGDRVAVAATLDQVVRELENAARSSAGTLARLTDADTGEQVALNATHVVLVRESAP